MHLACRYNLTDNAEGVEMVTSNRDIIWVLNRVKEKKKHLVCVGAGQVLKDACDSFSDFGFFDSLFMICDNYAKSFEWNGRVKTVYPIESIKEFAADAIIYICSHNYYIELFEQLNGILELKENECFIHNYVGQIPLGERRLSTLSEERIPRKIHYCWFGKGDIPKKNLEWMQTWREKCPDYEIIRWDESNYDYKKNRFMKEAYDAGKYAFVSDCARLEIVYENGGIYLDNDVELLKKPDPLLRNHAFCGMYYSIPGVAFGLGFGGERHFELFMEMFEYYNLKGQFKGGKTHEETCLFMQTEVVKKYGWKNINRQQFINNLTVFPTDVLAPMDVDGNIIAKTDNSVTMHHFDASWFDDERHRCFESRKERCREFYNKYYRGE